MRRSFRDAIVGFSLVGGVVIFSGLTLWLKGIQINSKTWIINTKFKNASGLSVGTPVTFRGIKIGNVKDITFTPKDVQATIRINNDNLILFKPVSAKIETGSLLGGDAAISIISKGLPIKNINYFPKSKDCQDEIILCSGDSIEGGGLNNISQLTDEINKFLNETEELKLLNKMVSSIEQFDDTQKNFDDLIKLAKIELIKTKPILYNLEKSSIHMKNILSSIDDPEILNDVKSSTRSLKLLTEKLDKISYKVDELLNDDELTNAFKDAAIGIGRLFNDIYE